jgi:hypothetical protein
MCKQQAQDGYFNSLHQNRSALPITCFLPLVLSGVTQAIAERYCAAKLHHHHHSSRLKLLDQSSTPQLS